MNIYKQFHGDIPTDRIGQELRRINKTEKGIYKILTGFGSTTGICKSKESAIKALRKMKKEKMIKGFIPADKLTQLLQGRDEFFDLKVEYDKILKRDKDYGNDGVIYIIIE